jgi:hypothetical protein
MRGVAALSVSAVMLASTAAMAAEKVSAEVGASYNTHFISYGADVWGGGTDFYGDRSTTFVWGSVTVQATDALSFNLGAWADVNNNTTSAIGGELQEVDVWFGGKVAIGKATVGATYQSWNYAGDVEEIIDLSLGFDDSGILPIALNPGLIWHFRTSGNGTQETGSAVVVSVGPSFKLTDTLSLTIPAGVGFFLDDGFQGGTEDGYAYSYIGGSLGIPITFIPAAYGSWALNFDLIAYFTDSDAIPNNPEENFVTGSVGLKLTF